jgi:succinate dehydrogenase / fumarate reductase cytochrome b subunit
MEWALKFWGSSVGKKAAMAVSGLVGFGFVIGHMLGNLQVYLGAEKLNAYAKSLHDLPPLLYGTRAVLLLAILVHVTAAIQLQGIKVAARPVRYQKPGTIQATPQSKSMILTGGVLFAFIMYHLAHLTFAPGPTGYLNVYANLVAGFQNPLVSAFYIVAMVLLGLHLAHGAFSMFYSLGLVHPKYLRSIRLGTYALMGLVVVGNISIPVSVLAGVVK